MRHVAASTAAVIAALAFGCSGHSGGDPGGRILGALARVNAALPAAASVHYRHQVEPKWDHCDHKPHTAGWDDAVVQVHFNTTVPDNELIDHASAVLAQVGWEKQADAADGQRFDRRSVRWTRNSFPGPGALVILSNNTTDGAWDLFATAPPRGTRVSGC